jgi:conjugative relaxase-like TrwC/TraI family protein
MLEMKRINGVDYYNTLAKSEYYASAEKGEPPGVWGEGARLIGIQEKTIDNATLKAVMTGHKPNGEKLAQNAGKENFRVGMDLTFSAPKSVSIVWANADPQLREEISQAQAQAIEAAMAYMTPKIEARRGHNGTTKETPQALIYGVFEHCNSRANDPTLHSHCVVSNTCVRQDGTTGAIDQRGLFEHKLAAGTIYRAHLANAMQRLGFGIEPDPHNEGIFQVAGVPKDLEKHFSKRAEHIKKVVRETGQTSAESRNIIARDTRDKKGEVNRLELFTRWQTESQAQGFDMAQVKATQTTKTSMPTVADLIEKLTEQNSCFELKHVEQLAATFQQFDPSLNREQLQKQILEHPDCIKKMAYKTTQNGVEAVPVFTSKRLEDLEKNAIQSATNRQHETTHQLAPAAVAQVVADFEKAQGFTLFADQRQAVEHITTQSGGVALVRGLAGTGKTTALRPVVDAYKQAGFQVLGTTTTAKAVAVLEKETGMASHTTARLLIDLDKKKTVLNSKTVIILDEAGMVDSRQFARLQQHADKAGAKLVLIGDERQLQSVAAGGIFWALQQHGQIKTADLTTITRQQDGDERKASLLFYQGKADEALKIYEGKGAIVSHANRLNAIENLARDYAQSSSPSKVAICATNADAQALNDAIRDELKLKGEISPTGAEFDNADGSTLEMCKGDRILFKKNNDILGVKNNEVGKVLEVQAHKNGGLMLTIETEEGQKTIDTNDYNHFKHAHAITTHASQGSTYKNSFYLYSSGADLHQSYVALTRHKDSTKMYCTQYDKEDMAQGMAVAHIKQTTLDLKTPEAAPEIAPKVAPTLGQNMTRGNSSSLTASTVGKGQQPAGVQMPEFPQHTGQMGQPIGPKIGPQTQHTGPAQGHANGAAKALQMGLEIGQKAMAEAHASQAESQAQAHAQNQQAHAWAQQKTKTNQEIEM